MRLLQIGLSYHQYAQGSIAESIHKHLLSLGNESQVFFSDNTQCVEDGVKLFETKQEDILKRGLRHYFGKRQLFAMPGTLRLIRMISQYDPELIQFHNIHHLTVDYPLLFRFLEKRNSKLVFTVHDMWTMTGGCYHFTGIGCNKFMARCDNCPKDEALLDCPKKKTARNFQIKKQFYSMTNPGFVYVSNWLFSECSRSYLSNYRYSIIPNGVDTGIFEPGKREYFRDKVQKEKKIVLGVSNYWDNGKGFEQFEELAIRLGDDYVIVLIGAPPLTLDHSKIPPNLLLWGRTDSKQELAEAYSSADVFVHLSKEETFGLVLAEAACCGTVPIGYDSTGVKEVVCAAYGKLISVDDTEGVGAAVREICKNGQRLSGEQLANVRRVFSMDTMARKYIDFYDRMLDIGEQTV